MKKPKFKCPQCGVKLKERAYSRHLANAHNILPRVVKYRAKTGKLSYRLLDTVPKKKTDAYDVVKRLPGAGFSKQ